MFLKISQNLHENTCVRVSFLIQLQAEPATLLKKDPGTGAFLCNLRNFLEHFFKEHFQTTAWIQAYMSWYKPRTKHALIKGQSW